MKMLYCIRVVCNMRYKLKKRGPTFEDRMLNQARHSILGPITAMRDAIEVRSKARVVDFLKASLAKRKIFYLFLQYNQLVLKI